MFIILWRLPTPPPLTFTIVQKYTCKIFVGLWGHSCTMYTHNVLGKPIPSVECEVLLADTTSRSPGFTYNNLQQSPMFYSHYVNDTLAKCCRVNDTLAKCRRVNDTLAKCRCVNEPRWWESCNMHTEEMHMFDTISLQRRHWRTYGQMLTR